jgi:ATP-dependent Clp protease ATP-binding subunit ClpX
MQQIVPEDLMKFGIIPEFIGRIPIIAALEKLTEDDLVRILTEPKNALVKQYQKLLSLDDTTLEFTNPALHAIAHQAIERDTGARGLRSIIEAVMQDLMFELPSRPEVAKAVVTKAAVEGKGAPEMILEDGQEAS